MGQRVPGVTQVEAKATEDGRLVLRFKDGTFRDPFIARYVSDGTIKMFAYLILLHDPKPHPVLAVEEPENQLYPRLLKELVEEFRNYAVRGGQVFVSTHSPSSSTVRVSRRSTGCKRATGSLPCSAPPIVTCCAG